MTPTKLVLASSSPYRRQLLQKLRMEFSWASPEIDESPKEHETPEQLVLRLAKQKATALADIFPEHLIIGSDQIATLNNRIIGKPHTHKAATSQLASFSGKEVVFLTSLCLYNSKTHRSQLATDKYTVKFRQLNDRQIDSYLRQEEPYDCAGSFKSEGMGICLFERMEGKDPNTLVGLPLIELTDMLMNEGIDPLSFHRNH
ncbi:Maf family protein [Cellvibrio mixtus]|uniref:Maf family protein n=1 Tax=Cellvibrio mixtus TaxID=39650 RepID=UPI00058695DB|nr:Maf family nucleotide pyrophosphatase [Cellvibrio mixtus]